MYKSDWAVVCWCMIIVIEMRFFFDDVVLEFIAGEVILMFGVFGVLMFLFVVGVVIWVRFVKFKM